MKRNYWVTYGQFLLLHALGGSVAEWLAFWTQAQTGLGLNRCPVTVLHPTVHTHRASVHQAAKLVAALLRVARVTAGLAESNGSLPPGFWLTSPVRWLPRIRISSGTLRSVIEYGLPFSMPCGMQWFRHRVCVGLEYMKRNYWVHRLSDGPFLLSYIGLLLLLHYFVPVLRWTCLFVGVLVWLSASQPISGTTRPIFTIVWCVLPIAVAPFSCGDTLCTSGFMDGLMFAHNGQE